MMAKKQNGTRVLPNEDKALGIPGGGWVSGIKSITSDGYIVARDDTQLAYILEPNGKEWKSLFRFGDNLPMSQFQWRTLGSRRCYDVDICRSDSTRIVGVAGGKIQTSSDRGASFQQAMAYKVGATDNALFTQQQGRIGCGQLMIDPFNKDVWGLGHTVDGFYFTETNGAGAAMLPHPHIPTPINPGDAQPGIRFAFDAQSLSDGKCQRLAAIVPGRGVYKWTAGISGAAALVAGSPTVGTSIVIANNRIMVCGAGSQVDSQVRIHNGTNWSAPVGIEGNSVCVDPSDPMRFIVMTVGGGMHVTTDGGVNWTTHNYPTVQDGGDDQPWIETTDHAYSSVGAIMLDRWNGRHRLWFVHGLGVSFYENPPRASGAVKAKTLSNGIHNILLMGGSTNPLGTTVLAGQDRPYYRIGKGEHGKPVRKTYPAPQANNGIRHANDADWAIDDPTWWVGSFSSSAETLIISTDDFKTAPMLTVPFTYPAPNQAMKYFGGQLAVTVKGKFVWGPASNAPMKGYDNGEWFDPVFRSTPSGTVVDMGTARWHHAYWLRRKSIVADKENPGVIWAFCFAASDNIQNPLEASQYGLWKSVDHGRNFVMARAGTLTQADFNLKVRLVPGFMGTDMFACSGNVGGDEDPNVNDGAVVFSSNLNAASPTFTTLTGFHEPEDIGFDYRPTSRVYPRVVIVGHKMVNGSKVYGRWASDDFNRLNPNAATWTNLGFPEGRQPGGAMLITNMTRNPGLITITPGGEAYFEDDPVRLLVA